MTSTETTSVGNVEQRLVSFVTDELLGGDGLSLDLDTQLLTLGVIDSLNMVRLLAFVESEFGVLVPNETVTPTNFASVRAIAALVHGLLGQAASAAPRTVTSGSGAVFEPAFNLLAGEGIARHRFTTPGGDSVHYLTVDGQEPTWLLLPGLGAPSSSWGPVLQMLEGETRAIAVDFLGFGVSRGRTDCPTLGDQIDAVLALVDAVVPGPMVVVGNSAGALVATEVARRRPERLWAVSLIGFGLLDDPQSWRRQLDALSHDVEDFLRFAYHRPPRLTPNLSAVMQEIVGSPAYGSFLDDGGVEAMRSAFDGLRVPTLLMAGQEDRFFPPATVVAAANRIQDAKVEILARCGHFAPMEQPSEVGFLIDQFIRKLDLTGARQP